MTSQSQITIGIVGAGYMGQLRAQTLLAIEGARLVAVADVDTTRAQQLAPSPDSAFESVDELLQQAKPHAVIISTSEAAHRDAVVKALDAGAHVLVEKPMATTIADCDAMIAAGRRAGTTLMVGHTLRFDTRYAQAAEQIQEGRIGDPIHAYCRRNNRVVVPARLGYSCSVLQFLAVHEFDWLGWALADQPTHVFAAASRKRLPVDDAVLSTVKFARGAVAVIETSWVLPDSLPVRLQAEAQVVGTEGAVSIDGSPRGPLVMNKSATHLDDIYTANPFGRPCGAVVEETRYFIRCARGEAAPLADGAAGRGAVAVMVAAQHSLEEGKEVSI